MPQPNAYILFVLKACAARNRLIKSGASKIPAAKSYEDMKRLKLWIEFYGNKGEQVVRAWFWRELATIEAVMPPNFNKQLNELLDGDA
jgi:hypothetical protein